jgi:hypothetical protein
VHLMPSVAPRLVVTCTLLTVTILQSTMLQSCSAAAPPVREAGMADRPAEFRIEKSVAGPAPDVVPLPRRVQLSPGRLLLGSSVTIGADEKDAGPVALQLASELRRLGVSATVDDADAAPVTIRLATSPPASSSIRSIGISPTTKGGASIFRPTRA